MTIDGKKIRYTAIAEESYLFNLANEPIGSIFSFSYLKKGKMKVDRPVLFIFNGGPGSSSLWLHIGILGPKRIVFSSEINPRNVPPFDLVTNSYCLLDIADLVFIDPIGTGFSKLIGKGRPEDFFGVDQDAESFAKFIDTWLTQHDRWNSPKFILGESYGSTRAVILPRTLMGGPSYTGTMRGITVNGVITLGTTVTDPDVVDSAVAEWAIAKSLPSIAATAWYHNKIKHSDYTLPNLLEEVNEYAKHDYSLAIKKELLNVLLPQEKEHVIKKLCVYTGLPPGTFTKSIKLMPSQFAKSLLSDQHLNIGMYDSRYTMSSLNDGSDPVADDPAMGQYVPGFIAAFHDLLFKELKVEMNNPYEAIVWRNLNNKWDWHHNQVPGSKNFASDLAVAMRRNKMLKVFVASGYYDLVTTAMAARHDLEKAELPSGRVLYKTYESGHMLYLGRTAAEFASDLKRFILSAVK